MVLILRSGPNSLRFCTLIQSSRPFRYQICNHFLSIWCRWMLQLSTYHSSWMMIKNWNASKRSGCFSTQRSTRLYLILTYYACMNNLAEVLIIACARSLFAKSKVQSASVRSVGLLWSLFFMAYLYLGGIWQDLQLSMDT